MEQQAYIIGAVRTPVGRRGGTLAGIHPADLGAHVLGSLVRRTGVDPDLVDEVILGCIDQVGPQAGDIARTAWLAAGLPESVPGTTIDRQCGSSQQAVHFAAQAVLSGTSDLVVAGGVQSMSQVPMAYAQTAGRELGFEDAFRGSTGWVDRYGAEPFDQFRGAERIAADWSIDRDTMERLALASHQRAVAAIDGGRFVAEIEPIAGVDTDQGPRRDTSLEQMAQLPALMPDGRLTAALSSQISDGAAALLIASSRAVAQHGLTPRARIHHLSARGADPIIMLDAPIPATKHALDRAGMTLDDIDVVEINEAFASVVLAWARALDAPMDRVNVNGGAIALGHPIGATGARLTTSMLHELERSGGRYGLQVMCEAGGQANVTIIERL